jgi:arsenite methyltransferase
MDTLNAEAAVRDRYAAGAKQAEAQLCCPVEYDSEMLKVIPQEVIAPSLARLLSGQLLT